MPINTEPKKAMQYQLLPEKEFCKVEITKIESGEREYQGQKSPCIKWQFTALDYFATNKEGNKVPIMVLHTTGNSMKFKNTFGNANKLLQEILKTPFDENIAVDVEALCLGKKIEVMVSHYEKKDGTKGQKLSMIK